MWLSIVALSETEKFTWTTSPEAEGARNQWRGALLSVAVIATGVASLAGIVIFAATSGPQRVEPVSVATGQTIGRKPPPSLTLSAQHKDESVASARESPPIILLNPGSAGPGYQREAAKNDHVEAQEPAKESKSTVKKVSSDRVADYLALRAYVLGQ
jgi:hypothetical protein